MVVKPAMMYGLEPVILPPPPQKKNTHKKKQNKKKEWTEFKMLRFSLGVT